ncbi:MAG: hypothetical protein WBP45_16145 [Daejeonella sp.]
MKRTKKMYYLLVPMVTVFSIFSGCHKQEGVVIKLPSKGVLSNTEQYYTAPDCNNKKLLPKSLKIFPSDNAWNLDISQSPVDPLNTQIISKLNSFSIKADFGQGQWQGNPIGIPYSTVCGEEPMRTVIFRGNSYDNNYGHESDPGPYPIPLDAPIEGNGNGDSHVIVVDRDNKKLYELYNASVNNGQWEASCGAIFDLNSNAMRPDGWTSADGAGLPIFPGLVKYQEILWGEIKHPIRFTLQQPFIKSGTYIHPANHIITNATGGGDTLPLGARIRLKQNYDISGFSPVNQIILRAMKKYGLILADAGSNLFISGTPDARWDDGDLQKLNTVKGANFEVVKFNP